MKYRKKKLKKKRNEQREMISQAFAKYCKSEGEIDIDERVVMSISEMNRKFRFFEDEDEVIEMVKKLTELYEKVDNAKEEDEEKDTE